MENSGLLAVGESVDDDIVFPDVERIPGLVARVESVEDDIVFPDTSLSFTPAQIDNFEYSDSLTPAADGSRAGHAWNWEEIVAKMLASHVDEEVEGEEGEVELEGEEEEEDEEEEDDDDALANWDPMSDHYYSGFNWANIDPDVPGVSQLGARAPKPLYKACDIQCRFFKEEEGDDYCWKGPECPNMHLKAGDPQLGEDGTRIKKLAIAMAKNFLPKLSMHTGANFDVKVSYAFSPELFYITKESDICQCDVLGCDAKLELDEDIDDDPKAETITELVTREMKFGFMNNRSSCFRKNEIVAVKVEEENGSIKFYRGMMLENVTTFLTDVIREKEVLVTLIDTGETKKHLLWKVFRYDIQLDNIIPPRAYRCSLTGISPLFSTWSSQSCEYFKDLIKNRNLRLEVENTVLFGKGAHLEKKPYQVKLSYIEECDGRKVRFDVADQMIKSGYGVAWNPVPHGLSECRNKTNNNLFLATKRFDRM